MTIIAALNSSKKPTNTNTIKFYQKWYFKYVVLAVAIIVGAIVLLVVFSPKKSTTPSVDCPIAKDAYREMFGSTDGFLSDCCTSSLSVFCLNNRITAISWADKNATGILAPSFSKLPFLTLLDVRNNSLTGTIPEALCKMRLQSLFVSHNKLTGSIPDCLFRLPSLSDFNAAYNELSGNLPTELNLSSLRTLNLFSNRFFGSIPQSYSPIMQNLILGSNSFSGSLDITFSGVSLILSNNLFNSSLDRLFSDSRITALDVSGNAFTSLPALAMSSLATFYAHDNFITTIAAPITSTQIRILDLSNNPLSQGFTDIIGNVPRVETLRLRNCSLTGSLPTLLKDSFSNMLNFDISNNGLGGQLPDIPDLRNFNASFNNFTGPFPVFSPDSSGLLPQYLRSLDLNSNQFSGNIDFLANSVNLEYLDLGRNRFTGTLPSFLGSLLKIKVLRLNGNQFSGTVDPSIGALDLEDGNLDGNSLQEPYPRWNN